MKMAVGSLSMTPKRFTFFSGLPSLVTWASLGVLGRGVFGFFVGICVPCSDLDGYFLRMAADLTVDFWGD